MSDDVAAAPHIALVSASLAECSRSRVAIDEGADVLRTAGCTVDVIDLSTLDLQLYPRSEDDPKVLDACGRFDRADGLVLGTPIYNFGVSGALLSFLHYAMTTATGERWKPFCVLASMAGTRSAMAADAVVRSVTYERSAVAVGPPIIVSGDGVDRATGVVSDELRQRIQSQLRVLAQYAAARRRLPRWS